MKMLVRYRLLSTLTTTFSATFFLPFVCLMTPQLILCVYSTDSQISACCRFTNESCKLLTCKLNKKRENVFFLVTVKANRVFEYESRRKQVN